MMEPTAHVDWWQVGEPANPIDQRLAVSDRRNELAGPSAWGPTKLTIKSSRGRASPAARYRTRT